NAPCEIDRGVCERSAGPRYDWYRAICWPWCVHCKMKTTQTSGDCYADEELALNGEARIRKTTRASITSEARTLGQQHEYELKVRCWTARILVQAFHSCFTSLS